MSDQSVAFIGAGNMAEALVGGMLKAKLFLPSRVRVADIDPLRLKYFATNFKVTGFRNNRKAVTGADIVVLAVKPQVLPGVLAELKASLPGAVLVVSIAAGVKTGFIAARLRAGARVIRVMPNTAALVGQAAAAFCGGSRATKADARQVTAMFRAVGVIVKVREDDMDAVTALSGSGPAYVFYLLEAMLSAAAKMGLDKTTARTLSVATVAGAAHMLAETGLDPRELRRRVTSKGGTTEAAFAVLEKHHVLAALLAALVAARKRSRELTQ